MEVFLSFTLFLLDDFGRLSSAMCPMKWCGPLRDFRLCLNNTADAHRFASGTLFYLLPGSCRLLRISASPDPVPEGCSNTMSSTICEELQWSRGACIATLIGGLLGARATGMINDLGILLKADMLMTAMFDSSSVDASSSYA